MASLPMQTWKQTKPLVKLSSNLLSKSAFNPWNTQRDKVVFIMGATGTGKSRLSIDLATVFPAEIINSDKIQVYKGLDIVTNKVTKEEQCGVPHHLLGIVNPNVDYTAKDFCLMATHAVESILQKDKLPIIVGGSNSYIESLVTNPKYGFESKYTCCFLWIDVCIPVLNRFVSQRVDKMVRNGLVDEVRNVFDPNNLDYNHGIRRAIGVPELDAYFRTEHKLDVSDRVKEIQVAINDIKANTCKLANKQVQKLYLLKNSKAWKLNRLDATEVLHKYNKDAAYDETWQKIVSIPSLKVVSRFISSSNNNLGSNFSTRVVTRNMIHEDPILIATT